MCFLSITNFYYLEKVEKLLLHCVYEYLNFLKQFNLIEYKMQIESSLISTKRMPFKWKGRIYIFLTKSIKFQIIWKFTKKVDFVYRTESTAQAVPLTTYIYIYLQVFRIINPRSRAANSAAYYLSLMRMEPFLNTSFKAHSFSLTS